MSGRYFKQYDDDWIFEHWWEYRNWLSLCTEYNKVHETDIFYETFRCHCERKLGLTFKYSNEEEAFLKEHYPTLGYVKTAELFNQRFKPRSPNGIKIKCKKLGLKVTPERKKAKVIEVTGRYWPIGSEVKKQHGEIYVKTEDGFKRKKDILYGEIPKDHALVYLDGNKENCNKDNLVAVKRPILALMTTRKFWSKNPDLTKTGILCCELEDAIKKKEEIDGEKRT